ncbi:MAG: hypothetical protein ACK49H_03650, partial [Burkholderiales bacterium]
MTSRTMPCALALVALLQGCGVLHSERIEGGQGDRSGGSAAVSAPAGAALSSTRQPPPAISPSST